MKIAAALSENHLKANIDPHFGRCDWFVIYDTQTNEHIYIENLNRYNEESAGCKSAEMLASKQVQMVMAGRFGAKVIDFFKKNNIQMVIPETPRTWEAMIKLINH